MHPVHPFYLVLDLLPLEGVRPSEQGKNEATLAVTI